ncbi:MAG: anion permease [Candidatus Omnitrophica bacterium]|nr:anion permease [Candidatus Omnitrophota bacterium]
MLIEFCNQGLLRNATIIYYNFSVFLVTVYFLFKKCLCVPPEIRERVIKAIPHLAIVDKKNMIKSLVVLGFIFIGFFMHDEINLKPGVVALLGSMIMLFVCKLKSEDILMRVEWGIILFFLGMFMMISDLEQNGVILWAANYMLELSGNNLFLMCVIILWGSAIFSSVLDNIPFVIVTALLPIQDYLEDMLDNRKMSVAQTH